MISIMSQLGRTYQGQTQIACRGVINSTISFSASVVDPSPFVRRLEHV